MKQFHPFRKTVVENAGFTDTSGFHSFLPARLFYIGAHILLFIFSSAFFQLLYAQPLSAYRNGRILTYYSENKYWFKFQDQQGFLWGTDKDHQTIRFDGYEAKVFHFDPFDSSSVNSPGFNRRVDILMEDSEGKVWRSAIANSLDRFDPVTEKFERFQDELVAVRNASPRTYHFLKEDSHKNIWIGTQSGLYKYSGTTGKFSFASVMWHVFIILEDREGNIWAINPPTGSARKIDFEDIRGGENLPFPPGIKIAQDLTQIYEHRAVTAPGKQRGNLFLISFDRNVHSFDVEARTILPEKTGLLPEESVTTLFNDSITLAGTDNSRILQYDHEKHLFSPFLVLPELPGESDPVLNIFRTRDNVLWVVTQKRTFQVLPATNSFKWIAYPPDLYQAPLLGMLEPLVFFQKQAYFNTQKGLQPLFQEETQTIPLEFSESDFDVPEKVKKPYLNLFKPKEMSGFKLIEDTLRSKLWLLLYQYPMGIKLFSFDEKGSQIFKLYCTGRDTCFDDQFLDIDIDKNGRLWMAGWAGVSCFDPSRNQFFNYTRRNGLLDLSTHSVLADDDGIIWIGQNSKGLVRFDTKNNCFDYYQYDPSNRFSLSTNYGINVLQKDQNGNIWVGTSAGLNKYDKEKNGFITYFGKDDAPHGLVVNLIEDKNKELWIATSSYLIKYNSAQNAFYKFDHVSGVPQSLFSDRLSFRDGKERIIFPTSEGVVYFHPDSVHLDTLVPRIVLTDYQLANQSVKVADSIGILSKSIAFTKALTLEYAQNVFTIRYAALEYLYPGETTYAFQLENFDPDWRMVGTLREATYTNLHPGEYLFKVKCRNHHGFWGEPITLQITILAPWYRTWLAYLIYALAGGSLLFAIRHYELNRQLARSEARRLAELDQVKNRLYTNITHEFRTPLTVINGMAERLYGQVDFTTREGLKLIKRNGLQLLNLVNQILDLAKLESGSLPVNLVQGDVFVFLKYLLESFRSLAGDKNISLQFKSSPGSFHMDFDPEKLRQIISNLVQNAIKFTGAGGRVEIVAIGKEDQLRIEVSDNGRGIPAEQLEKIFDRFHQVDDSATRSGEGTGIGLTLTRELVKLLGGHISVESEIGTGTQFTVLLPVTRQAGSAQPETLTIPEISVLQSVPAPEPTGPSSPLTPHPSLLIIEDNPDVVQYVSLVLKNDYQLLTATDGKSGLETALAEVPDLILSDVMMPEIDGYEVCRRLKNDLDTSHIPIVLLTAKADFDSRMEGLELGADAYLAKPFEEKELKIVLKKLLENRERLRQYYTSGEFFEKKQTGTEPDVQLPAKDREFFERFREVIEAHFDDPDFNTEQLSQLMFVSYATCLRKVKAMTGMAVNEYLRHIRLHRAAQWLLEDPDRSVTSISEAAGYSSHNYFDRDFKRLMGCSPSEYRLKKGKS